MSPEELTPGIVLKWLRLQSKKFTDTAQRYSETANKFSEAADVLESTVEPLGKTTSQGGHGTPAPHTRLFAQAAGSSS
jgi:hypothetical protein